MKKLLIAISLLIIGSAFAQDPVQNEQQIINFVGSERYAELQSENPSYLNFLDARISFGYQITDFDEDKRSTFKVLDEIPLLMPDKTVIEVSATDFIAGMESGIYSILMVKLPWDQSMMTYYTLGSTGKVLMIYPVSYINEKMNNQ